MAFTFIKYLPRPLSEYVLPSKETLFFLSRVVQVILASLTNVSVVPTGMPRSSNVKLPFLGGVVLDGVDSGAPSPFCQSDSESTELHCR